MEDIPNVKYRIDDLVVCKEGLSGVVTSTTAFSVVLDRRVAVPNSLILSYERKNDDVSCREARRDPAAR